MSDLLGKDDWIKRLQLEMSLANFKDQYATGVAGGGRVGYNHPLNNGSLTTGLSGSGYDVKTDQGRYRQFRPSGLDIAYQTGPHKLSADVGLGPERSLMLKYLLGF